MYRNSHEIQNRDRKREQGKKKKKKKTKRIGDTIRL